MSELVQKNDNRATIRWKLLTGASALALTAYIAAPGAAYADDGDRPLVWLELGGQLSRLQNKQEAYSPPFLAYEPAQFSSPLKAQRPPLYGLDLNGSISFQPEDSDWIFSASIRYGRAGSNNHLHQQSYPQPFDKYFYRNYFGVIQSNHYTQKPFAAQFIDAQSKNSETHALIDFQAGRDVGLGLFGHESSSSVSLGVRIAQFASKSRASLHENPDWAFNVHHYNFSYPPYLVARLAVAHQPYHSYAGQFEAARSFHGIGPSLSWKDSVPFAGNAQDGALTLDWGVNASLLFGRQKTQTHHQTTELYHTTGIGLFGANNAGVRTSVYVHPTAPDHTRSRNITVPNVGGFAGLSFRYVDAKISVGYKADFFFGAINGGIDTAKKENRGFFGPFASISVGLGD